MSNGNELEKASQKVLACRVGTLDDRIVGVQSDVHAPSETLECNGNEDKVPRSAVQHQYCYYTDSPVLCVTYYAGNREKNVLRGWSSKN